jgi:hypothetical protein
MNLDRNYLRDMQFATEVSSGRSFFEDKLVELRDLVLSDGIIFEDKHINNLFELDAFLSKNLSAFRGSIYEELKRNIINVDKQLSLSMPDKGVTFFIENATLDDKLEMLNWYCKPNVVPHGEVTLVECENMPFKEAHLDLSFHWKQDKIENIMISFSNKERADKFLSVIVSNDDIIYDSWLNRQIGTKRDFNWGRIRTSLKGIRIEIKEHNNAS